MNAESKAVSPEASRPPPEIAGFWRRIGASAIDWLVLGAVGLCAGFVLFDTFAALGGLGRLIGGAIAVGYFAVFNSRIASGQTIGKRALSLRVVSEQGEEIGVLRSSLRALVFVLPITLNRIRLSIPGDAYPVAIALAVCVFGIGGALVYLYVFNRRTRQSIHDLAACTFVVKAETSELICERIWRPHLAVAGAWILAVAIGPGLVIDYANQRESIQEIEELQQVAQSVVEGAELTVHKGVFKMTTIAAGASSSQYIRIRVYPRKQPSSYDEMADRIAAALLAECPVAWTVDRLSISITFGYDIMISRLSTTQNFSHSPNEWAERVGVDSLVKPAA